MVSVGVRVSRCRQSPGLGRASANVALGDPGPVAEYDQDELARARSYESVGVNGALWSLRRVVGDWDAALQLANGRDFEMTHPELGTMSLLDVVRIRSHDVHHHGRDLQRSYDDASA